MKKFKLSKKNYLLGFLIVTGVLALVRIIRPDVAGTHYSDQIDHSSLAAADSIGDEMVASNDGGVAETKESDATRLLGSSDIPFALTNFFNPDGSERRTRVRGVGSYRECFPDSQMVQLQAAERHGVSAVLDRADAEKRKGELVYVGSNLNPAKRNVLDLKNETCKNREKRNVLKKSHTRRFKATKKQSKTGCFYSF